MTIYTPASKNQNPREGIETSGAGDWFHVNNAIPSKNQNPREGIETGVITVHGDGTAVIFKKPKSPRGD